MNSLLLVVYVYQMNIGHLTFSIILYRLCHRNHCSISVIDLDNFCTL